MTVAQAGYALTKYGYSLDTWVCPKEYGSILLTHDSPCVINEDYCMIKIDSTNEMLQVVLGSLNEDGVFETKKTKEVFGDGFNPKPDWFIDLNEVAGFLGRSANNGVLYWTRHQ